MFGYIDVVRVPSNIDARFESLCIRIVYRLHRLGFVTNHSPVRERDSNLVKKEPLVPSSTILIVLPESASKKTRWCLL